MGWLRNILRKGKGRSMEGIVNGTPEKGGTNLAKGHYFIDVRLRGRTGKTTRRRILCKDEESRHSLLMQYSDLGRGNKIRLSHYKRPLRAYTRFKVVKKTPYIFGAEG